MLKAVRYLQPKTLAPNGAFFVFIKMGTRKENRIKDGNEFKRIIDQKKSFANKYFIVYIEENNIEKLRLGLSVGKKIGKAHQRVWVKRRIRQSINNLSNGINKNINLIVIARPNASGMTQKETESQIKNVLKIAGVIYE